MSASSCWPSPDAGTFNDGQRPEVWAERREREVAKGQNGNGFGTPLGAAVQLWPTPFAEEARATGNWDGHDRTNRWRPSLRLASEGWRTPRAPSPSSGGASVSRLEHDHPHLDLQDQAAMWATPAVPNGGRQNGPDMTPTGTMPDGTKKQVHLEWQVSLWATPTASMWRSEETQPGWRDGDIKHSPPLSRQVLQTELLGLSSSEAGRISPPPWPTPTTSATGASAHGQGGPDLRSEAAGWPTPTAEDGESSGHRPGRRAAATTLTGSARAWPTPTSSDANTSGHRSEPRTPTSHPGTTLTDAVVNGRPDRPKLNPAFVTWLMGWPEGWADAGQSLDPSSFACWATASCLWLQRLRGMLSLRGRA